MTSPPQRISVECPQCEKIYEDWWRPSINLNIEHFDDEYLEKASTSTCPACGHKVSHSTLIVSGRLWQIGP